MILCNRIIEWVGRDLEDHSVPTSLPRVWTASTTLGSSKPHPTWKTQVWVSSPVRQTFKLKSLSPLTNYVCDKPEQEEDALPVLSQSEVKISPVKNTEIKWTLALLCISFDGT